MKNENWILLGAAAIAAYLIYKTFSGNTAAGDTTGSSAGGSAGGYAMAPFDFNFVVTIPDQQNGNQNDHPTGNNSNSQSGSPNIPVENNQGIPISPNFDGSYTVPVINTIPNTRGGQNFPTVTYTAPVTRPPMLPAAPITPPKIQNIFGFPVVPHLVKR